MTNEGRSRGGTEAIRATLDEDLLYMLQACSIGYI